MKKNYALIVLLTLSSLSFGQVLIHHDDEPGIAFNGDTVVVTSAESIVYPHMHIVNAAGVSQQYKWKRVLIDSTPGFTDQLCDDQLCVSCTGNPWVGLGLITVPALDSTSFLPKLNTNGVSGTAHHRYFVLDNASAIIDSVDVIFTSTVGVDEKEQVVFSVYPNPASENLNIQISSSENNIQFVMYNVLGTEVMRKTLIDGLNVVSIEKFENGVYFYSVIRNNQIIETKKLIIRH